MPNIQGQGRQGWKLSYMKLLAYKDYTVMFGPESKDN